MNFLHASASAHPKYCPRVAPSPDAIFIDANAGAEVKAPQKMPMNRPARNVGTLLGGAPPSMGGKSRKEPNIQIVAKTRKAGTKKTGIGIWTTARTRSTTATMPRSSVLMACVQVKARLAHAPQRCSSATA